MAISSGIHLPYVWTIWGQSPGQPVGHGQLPVAEEPLLQAWTPKAVLPGRIWPPE